MQALRAVRTQIDEEKARFEGRLEDLLTTRQQARLLLFDSSFRSDLVDIVRRMRSAGRGGDLRGRNRGPQE